MENYFSKLSNNLFYSIEEEINILKECKDYKVLLVLDYLYTYTNRRGITVFTLGDMVEISGFKQDSHKGKINDKFKDILIKLQELKIIESDIDLNKIKSKELIKCNVNLFNKNEEGKDIRFIQLFDTEKEKILNYKQEKIDNLKLLYYYCYLKSRLHKRKKGEELEIHGGRAETCNPGYETIHRDIGLTNKAIKKYNDILVELNLIRIGNAGLWYYASDNNKIVRESNNIYTLWTEQDFIWKRNLKESIKFYKKQYPERKFTNGRKYKNNNKKINGYIARIEHLEQQGKATKEQVEKKNNYKKSINVDEKVMRRIGLLEKEENEGMILSEIYDCSDSHSNNKKFEEVYKLEKDLGLLDAEDNLTVDVEYYKWVITNYKKEKHNYFVNCIKKEIKEFERLKNSLEKLEEKPKEKLEEATKEELKDVAQEQEEKKIEEKVVGLTDTIQAKNDDMSEFEEFLNDSKDEIIDFAKIKEESKKLNEKIEKRRNEKITMKEINRIWG